jgi:hypothetical protein
MRAITRGLENSQLIQPSLTTPVMQRRTPESCVGLKADSGDTCAVMTQHQERMQLCCFGIDSNGTILALLALPMQIAEIRRAKGSKMEMAKSGA